MFFCLVYFVVHDPHHPQHPPPGLLDKLRSYWIQWEGLSIRDTSPWLPCNRSNKPINHQEPPSCLDKMCTAQLISGMNVNKLRPTQAKFCKYSSYKLVTAKKFSQIKSEILASKVLWKKVLEIKSLWK